MYDNRKGEWTISNNKTQATSADVMAFLKAVPHLTRRADGLRLNALFLDITGWAPRMWGASIVGYGQYHYKYDSGREGDFLATGFSPRTANLSIYVMPGYADFTDELARLGKHKMGKSCLYINTLADVDETVLADIIAKGLTNLKAKYPVQDSPPVFIDF